LVEDSRNAIDRGARRRDAAQHPVHLVVFPHDGLVESFDVRTAVISRGQDAVMLELDYSLLDRHTAEPEFLRDLVAVDPIPRAKFARQ